MIKATELRLGNYVRCKIYNGNKDVVIPFVWQEAKYIHLFEPIPLTEEWLKRFGFESRLINNAFNEWYTMCTPPNYKREFALCFRFGEYRDVPRDQYTSNAWHAWMSSGDSHSFNIQYIHQLQNLYFALTGQELTLKEPI